MIKDALARGARSAVFQMGGDSKDAPISLHNVAKEETEAVPALVDNLATFAPKKPAIYYKGQPLNDRILIKRKASRESNSVIVIPDSAKAKSDVGYVVSVAEKNPLNLKAGMLVLFDRFAAVGGEINLLDESGEESEHLIVQECDLMLVLTEHKNEAELVQ